MAAATVFIEKGANISEIDKGCKNKWSWGWLDSIDSLGDKIELWCKKTNHKGEAFCVPCCKPVKYTLLVLSVTCCELYHLLNLIPYYFNFQKKYS